MKTTVVPAQITTVEDRIAGNLTFAQILLLILPLSISTLTYVVIGPRSRLTIMKGDLMLFEWFVLGVLSVRVNGKIVADWLRLFLRFTLRPCLYVFTKNDLASREMPGFSPINPLDTPQGTEELKPELAYPTLSEIDQFAVDQLLENPGLSIRFQLSKKGGVDVSLAAVKH